jgi:serine/threonine-protein kinase
MHESKIERKIKHARIAALVSGTITLAGSLSIIWNQTPSQFSFLNILSLLDVIFIFSMAYGIYRKSRICAVLMFEYFLLSKIFNISISTHINSGVIMVGSIFLYFMFQGINGTFAYHKCKTCREGKEVSKPLGWILAGSGGLIVYVMVLPGLIV